MDELIKRICDVYREIWTHFPYQVRIEYLYQPEKNMTLLARNLGDTDLIITHGSSQNNTRIIIYYNKSRNLDQINVNYCTTWIVDISKEISRDHFKYKFGVIIARKINFEKCTRCQKCEIIIEPKLQMIESLDNIPDGTLYTIDIDKLLLCKHIEIAPD